MEKQRKLGTVLCGEAKEVQDKATAHTQKAPHPEAEMRFLRGLL